MSGYVLNLKTVNNDATWLAQVTADTYRIFALEVPGGYPYYTTCTLRAYSYNPVTNLVTFLASTTYFNWARVYFDGAYVHSGFYFLGDYMYGLRALQLVGGVINEVADAEPNVSVPIVIGSVPYIWIRWEDPTCMSFPTHLATYSFAGAYTPIADIGYPGYDPIFAAGTTAYMSNGTSIQAYDQNLVTVGPVQALPINFSYGDTDGTYLYIGGTSSAEVRAYTFDGSIYTYKASVTVSVTGNVQAIKCFARKIVVITTTTIAVYAFDGTTFTLLASQLNVGPAAPIDGTAAVIL